MPDIMEKARIEKNRASNLFKLVEPIYLVWEYL